MRFPNRFFYQSVVLLVSVFEITSFAADGYPNRPLSDRTVVALVAGAVLPESVAEDVRTHGLTFHPSEQYLSRLSQIGADPLIIDVLKKSKVQVPDKAESHSDDTAVLDHLFAAGEKMKAKKFVDAVQEVTSASKSLEDHPEMAFVVGEVLKQEEAFAQADALYSKLIEIDSEFPEAHTKLSYVLYRTDDTERGVAEAKAALARTPNNAEAHKNMGLNLAARKQFDAAITEYQKALALKPDYAVIHYDLGVLYYNRDEYRKGIEENRKALASDPSNAGAHYNLALDLANVDERGPAITEFREAIRLQPNQPQARMNLASLLVDSGDRDGGIEEFRKLIRLSPDSSYCHQCFASLLYRADRLDESEREYRTALQLDAGDADSHYGLGLIFKHKQQQDEALKEFLQATKLGLDTAGVHRELARIYLARKQNEEALTEIKQALSLTPANGSIHEQLADILVACGKPDDAVVEYQQAYDLQGHTTQEGSDISRKLAALNEKLGRYPAALLAYRQMYDSFPCEKTRADYESAQKRLSSHLTQPVQQAKPAPDDQQGLPVRWLEKSGEMQTAMAEKRWKEAEESGKQAIAIAEQMEPQDSRLIASIELMGTCYRMQTHFKEAEQQFLEALSRSEKLLGTNNLQTMFVLSALGHLYFETKNYSQAVEYLTRSFGVAQTLYGPTYGYEYLDLVGQSYKEQHMFDKAEEAYKKMLAADEMKNGPSSPSSAVGLEHLGLLYFDMGRYEEARSSLERVVLIQQKQFGPNSTTLERELARALRGLGKQDEARDIGHRRELLAQTQSR